MDAPASASPGAGRRPFTYALSLLSFRPGKIGGAETFVRRLLAELPAAAAGDRLVAIMDRELAASLDTPGWDRVVVERGARRIVVDRILEAVTPWRDVALERQFAAVAADVIHFPQQSVFPKRVAGRVLLTVVDVQHLYHPERIALGDRLFRRAIYGASMARADHLIAISEFTRTTLLERCGVAPARVTALQLGHDPSGRRDPPTDLVVGPYLFYPAATFAHKEHATLLRSWAALKSRGEVTGKLVLSGMKTPLWKGLERLARDLGVGDEVVHLGFLPFAEVRRVYAGADAIVFPSRYEGFGIPVVEASLEFGKKVITSRLPVFDEIGVPPERQIDFTDPAALRRALALPGPTVLTRRPPSWAEWASATLALARRVAGR
jgi:glycosyltransferase involved in cell wall biosynthesis